MHRCALKGAVGAFSFGWGGRSVWDFRSLTFERVWSILIYVRLDVGILSMKTEGQMQLLSTLRQVDIFYEIPDEKLKRLIPKCEESSYESGEIIVKENSPSDELYIIVDGIVEIVIDPSLLDPNSNDIEPTVIATLWPGQTFGEIGLVDRGMRSASARSSSDKTVVLSISRDGLLGLCDADHHFGYLLMRNIASDLAFKVRNTDLMLREQLLWQARPPV